MMFKGGHKKGKTNRKVIVKFTFAFVTFIFSVNITVTKIQYDVDVTFIVVGAEAIPNGEPLYVKSVNPLVFEISEVIWEDKNGENVPRSDVKNVTLTNSCTKGYNQKPKSFFCLNENTGKIYMTSDLVKAVEKEDVEADMKFKFTINITMTEYPYLFKSLIVTLTLSDVCSPSNAIYKTLQEYVGYAILSPLNTDEDDNFLYYNLNASKLTLLTISLNAISLQPETGYIRIEDSELGNLTAYLDTEKLSSNTQVRLNLPFQHSPSLKIRLHAYQRKHESSSLGFINITNLQSSSLILRVVPEFNCTDQAITQYNNWRGSTNITKCLKDPENFDEYFRICLSKYYFS